MIAIKNVLVGTDYSDAAEVAMNYGRELARTYHAALHVIHVVDDIRWRYALDAAPVLADGAQESLEEAARAQMTKILTDDDRRALRATPVIESAVSVAEAIVDYARRANIDIIVAGTKGRGGVPRLLLGSVAERLVRMAPCPVLTVHAHERELIAPDPRVPAAKE